MFAKNDARIVWRCKVGQITHATKVGTDGRTVCGLVVGKTWIPVKGKGHPAYRAKCRTCVRIVRGLERAAAKAAR